MKNMKKLWAALLALAMTFSLAACGGTSDEDAATDDQPTGEEVSGDTAPESDVAYIQDKGTLVVGITYFAPMDYKEEGSDEWIGFDADLARVIALQEVIWMGESFMKGNSGIAGLVWPLFFTAVYYLIFSGIVTVLLGKLEKKLDFFQ